MTLELTLLSKELHIIEVNFNNSHSNTTEVDKIVDREAEVILAKDGEDILTTIEITGLIIIIKILGEGIIIIINEGADNNLQIPIVVARGIIYSSSCLVLHVRAPYTTQTNVEKNK